jgi:pancreatic triacylglycerol lipase
MKFTEMLVTDPAGPLFTLQNRDGRLASTDANYVEVIHTNGGATGIGFPIGHAGEAMKFMM